VLVEPGGVVVAAQATCLGGGILFLKRSLVNMMRLKVLGAERGRTRGVVTPGPLSESNLFPHYRLSFLTVSSTSNVIGIGEGPDAVEVATRTPVGK
jgi:hypothetical protein